MISLVETTPIPVPPERVWRWFRELDRHYPAWHPGHLFWRTISGQPLSEGAVVFAGEWVGPMPVAGRLFITGVEPNRFFAYRIGFPSSLVRAGGWFRFEPAPHGGCRMTEEVHLGFSAPLVGPLVDRVLARVLPLRDLRRHLREEGEGLVRLLGQGGEVQAPTA